MAKVLGQLLEFSGELAKDAGRTRRTTQWISFHSVEASTDNHQIWPESPGSRKEYFCTGQPQAVISVAWRHGDVDGVALALTAPSFHCCAGVGIEARLELMNADEQHIRVRPEDLLSPLSMMDIPVENQDALHEIGIPTVANRAHGLLT